MQCVVCVLYTYNIQCVHNARRGPRPPDAVEMAYITLCINPYGNQCTRMQVQLGWSLKINLLRELHLAYNTAKYLNFIFLHFLHTQILQTFIAPDYTTHPHIIHKLHPYSAILLIEFS